MSSWRERIALAAAAFAVAAAHAAGPDTRYPGIGRAPTPQEIAAWNIDVRPDFQGLPRGSGSVARGQAVWEAQCASCHGYFGESRQVFAPLVGGTTAGDIATGHAARLRDPAYPERSMMMKLPTVSTLWDFVRRAMPWTAPQSLPTDDVYAVVAYVLNLSGVVPDDFTLSQDDIAAVQQRLPNRNGMTTRHGLWPGPEFGDGRPDVQGSSCMAGCGPVPRIASSLPEHARGSHGNLAEQLRLVGATRGIEALANPAPVASALQPPALALLQGQGCIACHGVDNAIVGPAFRDIAARHGTRSDALAYLQGKIRGGGSGVWGAAAMPPQDLSDADAATIAHWLMDGAPK